MTSVGLVEDIIGKEKAGELNKVLDELILEDDILEEEISECVSECVSEILEDLILEVSENEPDVEILKAEIFALSKQTIDVSSAQLIFNKIGELAKLNNCLVISDYNFRLYAIFEWECQFGHKWKKRCIDQINTKHWCQVCFQNKKQETLLTKIKDFVQSKNGKCLSVTCEKLIDRIQLLCENNHKWETSAGHIIFSKTWCKKCWGNELLTIQDAKNIAIQRNGECLSNVYVNIMSKLLWKCNFGHTWSADLNSVKNSSTWCPLCNIRIGEEISRKLFEVLFNQKFERVRLAIMDRLELDGYCENLKLAFEYDGRQHSEFIKYLHGTQENFEDQQKRDLRKNVLCKRNNITLIRIPYTVKYDDLQEFITTECQKNNIMITESDKIDYTTFSDIYRLNENRYNNMKQLIEDKSGKILTDVFISARTFFNVVCSNNHTFRTNESYIKYGRWCPFCSTHKKITILDMQEIAEKNGGVCLSENYVNVKTKLKWRCHNNHIWDAVPESVLNGHWCDKCSREKVKLTILDMQKLASDKGGLCLSDSYVNTNTKLKWKCKNGHIWEAKPDSIIGGHWCSSCRSTKKLTILDMQELAKKKGGLCISDSYVNIKEELEWKCKNDHKFKETPGRIRYNKGEWCYDCKLMSSSTPTTLGMSATPSEISSSKSASAAPTAELSST